MTYWYRLARRSINDHELHLIFASEGIMIHVILAETDK